MARTFTVGQRTAIGADHDIYAKLELRDYDGDWTDVSTGLGGGTLDWLTSVTLEEDIDANTMLLNATLLRDNASTQSLSPLRTDSTLNRDNLGNYQPFLDVSRQWRASVAVIAHGATLVAGDWKEIGAGTYDVIDINSPSPTIQIVGRDWGATLLDKWIENKRTYGNDATPVAMETVIQALLDDNLGAAAVTLYTPTSPSFVMNAWEQQPMSLMQAISEVASKAGYVCKYRYDASDNLRLTLYVPSRTASAGSEVWTLGPSEYIALPVARLDLAGVRNRIVTRYYDSVAGVVSTVTTQNATSINRYGGPQGIARTLQIDLSKDTNILSSARATAFNTAVLSDLDTPAMEQQFETPGFWIAQLGDYGKFTQNGVHYDTDQYGGVTHIQHTIGNGTLRTVLSVRGQPAGRYRTWLTDRRIGVPELRIRNFREISRTTTDVTYGWDVEGPATGLWLWLNTRVQPVASEPYPATSTEPSFRLTPTTISYTVGIPVLGETTYGQLCAVDSFGQISRPWQFSIQGSYADIPQGITAIDATGVPTATIDGPDWVGSYRYATSTSAQPSDATALAGTIVSGRQLLITGAALALAGTFYLTAIPFAGSNANGYQGVSIRLRATRHDFSATKTLYFSAATFIAENQSTAAGRFEYASPGYIQGYNYPGIPVAVKVISRLQMPQGCTLTNFSLEIYHDTGGTGSNTVALEDISSSGAAVTTICSGSVTVNGWSTKSFSLSDSTTSRRYRVMYEMAFVAAGDITKERCAGYSVTYTMPTSDKAV